MLHGHEHDPRQSPCSVAVYRSPKKDLPKLIASSSLVVITMLHGTDKLLDVTRLVRYGYVTLGLRSRTPSPS